MGILIGLSGKARTGKDTFATMLAYEFKKQEAIEFVSMAFADEIKNELVRNFGLTEEQLNGNLKEKTDLRFVKESKVTYCDDVGSMGYVICWSPRELMQELGQFYRKIEANHWVRILFEKIDEYKLDNVIVTDIRQPNELAAIKNIGGYHVRMERENRDVICNSNHETETALDSSNIDIDFHIENNGTLEDLALAAKGVVKAIMIIENTKGGV